MIIEGKKNLDLMKRAYLSHLTYCSTYLLREATEELKKKWEAEIKEINTMLDAIEINSKRSVDDKTTGE